MEPEQRIVRITRGGPCPVITLGGMGRKLISMAWATINDPDNWPDHGPWFDIQGRSSSWIWQETYIGDAVILSTRAGVWHPMKPDVDVLAVCTERTTRSITFCYGLTAREALELQANLVVSIPGKSCLERWYRRAVVFFKGH